MNLFKSWFDILKETRNLMKDFKDTSVGKESSFPIDIEQTDLTPRWPFPMNRPSNES